VTASVYVIGGAGTGKSTFMAALLGPRAAALGPLEDLHAKPNTKSLVTLRGHRLGTDGMYLGCMRDEYPGTDGLDRASSPVGKEWLEQGGLRGIAWLVGEGATLATRPFMHALAEHSSLLLIHLFADDFVKDLRFVERGSSQADSFVTATATRSRNLALEMATVRARVWDVDSADPEEWTQALDVATDHLGKLFQESWSGRGNDSKRSEQDAVRGWAQDQAQRLF
jgi:hypothetical protein